VAIRKWRGSFAAMTILLPIVLLIVQAATVPDFTAAVDAYRAAIVAGDKAALDRLLHADFLIMSGDGQYRDKAGELADLVAEGFAVHEFRLDEPRYRVVGTTGMATGILRWRMTFQGRESTVERRTTMTWARDGSHWQMIGQHVSRLK
jgi:ketosteroid isomerase-like protein